MPRRLGALGREVDHGEEEGRAVFGPTTALPTAEDSGQLGRRALS